MFTSEPLPDGATDEARLRRWARENYVPLADRSLSWPGYILDEMRRQDEELLLCRENVVPMLAQECRVDASQPPFGAPKLLLRVATVPHTR